MVALLWSLNLFPLFSTHQTHQLQIKFGDSNPNKPVLGGSGWYLHTAPESVPGSAGVSSGQSGGSLLNISLAEEIMRPSALLLLPAAASCC